MEICADFSSEKNIPEMIHASPQAYILCALQITNDISLLFQLFLRDRN